MKRIIPFLFLVLLSSPLWATNYYVANKGNDGANGTSTGTAWATIAKVNASIFVPGDNILFNRGDMWREQLIVPTSGTSVNPITFTVYGTGALPIITGSDVITTWTQQTGNLWWKRDTDVPTNPTRSIYFNDTAGTYKSGGKGSLATDKDWYSGWSSDTVFIYSAYNPNRRAIEWSVRSVCILIDRKSYIIIDNIHVMRGKQWGQYGTTGYEGNIYVFDTSPHVTIQNCESTNGVFSGIRFEHGSNYGTVRNCTVHDLDFWGSNTVGIMFGAYGDATGTVTNMIATGNTVYNAHTGFYVYYTQNARIDSNTIYNCYQTGVASSWDDTLSIQNNILYNTCTQLIGNCLNIGGAIGSNTNHVTVAHNTIHDVHTSNGTVDGNGIEIDIGARHVNCYGNLIYNIDGAGICTYRSDSSSVYYNVIYNTGIGPTNDQFHSGIDIAPGSKTISFYNNTICSPGLYGIYLTASAETDSVLRITLKNNLVSGSTTYALYLVTTYVDTATLVSDYNNWYFSSGTMAKYYHDYYSTLTDYKTGTGKDTHSLSINPAFISTTNFIPHSGSPVIHAGVDVGLTRDYRGAAIIGLPDIGAYEYTGAITTTLPVQVTSFTGAVQGNTVALDWKTATEVNSYSFEIERRTTAQIQWESIGKMPAGGISNAPLEYMYIDSLNNFGSGSIFYRLKSVANDGSFQYSGEVEVLVTTAVTTTALPNIYALSQNYPNPFNPTTTINYQLQKAGSVSLKVYDMLGREVATLVNGEKTAGYYSATFDASRLSSGTYIYRLSVVPSARRDLVQSTSADGQSGSFIEVKKLVLLK
jgi:hypothetical protein